MMINLVGHYSGTAAEKELGGFRLRTDGWIIELFYKTVWNQGIRGYDFP
jgi:hypothetical protein